MMPDFTESGFLNSTLLLQPSAVHFARSAIQRIAEMQAPLASQAFAASSGFWDFEPNSLLAVYRPYQVDGNGVLTIPVKGLLLDDFGLQFGSMATGYTYIREAVKRAMNDDNVRAVALIVQSPGGVISGNFDLANMLYASRGRKPMRAIVGSQAASAAYSIASSADQIVASEYAEIGSIGVIAVHIEESKLLERMGVEVNLIRSKPRKMEGNRYEPLTDEARAALQAEIDEIHKNFVAIVARNRGMSEQAVDATDALVFAAPRAFEMGLIDQIAPPDDAVMAFAASLDLEEEGEIEMADKPQAAAIPQEQHAAAIETAKTTAHAAGVEEGREIGATAERERIRAILGSASAQKRPKAALATALKTGMSAEDAEAFLADMPEEGYSATRSAQPGGGAGAGKEAFEAAMGGEDHPRIEAGSDGDDEPRDRAASVVTDLHNFGLAGFRKSTKK